MSAHVSACNSIACQEGGLSSEARTYADYCDQHGYEELRWPAANGSMR